MTQKYVHALHGCAPTPLAHYLKALGVLRLVSEQADPEVRGAWVDDGFRLVTKLTREELITFFAEKYEPTPLLSPWNGGSGFYFQEGKTAAVDPSTGKRIKTGERDQPTAATEALAAIEVSTSPRLARWRQALAYCRSGSTARTSAPGKEEKGDMVAALRNGAPEDLLLWITTATSTVSADEHKSTTDIALAFPPLLGSGGNEGNFDYTSNQAQALLTAIERKQTSSEDVEAVLFGSAAPGQKGTSPGQFAPGLAGGANTGPGMVGESCFPLWDYILTLEGSLCLQASSVRLLGSTSKLTAAMPFTVVSSTAGYGSGATESETATTDQLMPLWRGAATMPEIRALFREGRLLRGGRAVQTRRSTQASLGGQAWGLRGESKQFRSLRIPGPERPIEPSRSPLGRIRSTVAPDRLHLLERARSGSRQVWSRAAGEKDASPASLEQAPRTVGRRANACHRRDGQRQRHDVGGLARCAGRGRRLVPCLLLARARAATSSPSPFSARHGSSGSRTTRRSGSRSRSRRRPATSSERSGRTWCPTKGSGTPSSERAPMRWFRILGWCGRGATSSATWSLSRIDGPSMGPGSAAWAFPSRDDGSPRSPTSATSCAGQPTTRASRGFCAVCCRFRGVKPSNPERTSVGEPSALHALVRLAFLPGKLEPSKVASRREDRHLPPLRPVLDGTILRLLEAGRVNDAADRVLTRLVAGGARPMLRTVAASPTLARRLAAAVAIPVSPADQVRLLRAVCKPFSDSMKDEAQS
jgi:CRISPR-associated protein Csx17